jgi:hypothetical protein
MDLNITGKGRSQKGFRKANFLFRIPQFAIRNLISRLAGWPLEEA